MRSIAPALPWHPILSSSLREVASGAIADLLTELEDPCHDDGSAACAADFGLLYGYLAAAEPEGVWQQLAAQYLNVAIDRASAAGGGWNALFGGVAGVGWTVEHIRRLLGSAEELEDEGSDPIGDIDALLIRRLSRKPWSGPYDLIGGLVGIGVYFLERLPRPAAFEGLTLVVEQLDDMSERSWGGVTWHTPPHQISQEQRETFPDGYYNLGVAHGVPGVVYLLSEAVRFGIEQSRASRLLEGSIEWLLARQRPPEALSRFSNWFMPGHEPTDSRVAWCYGDLGIGAVWLHAARAIGRADWSDASLALLERTLRWPANKDKIIDTPLCHGAFGVAHVCNRVYHTIGNERYCALANGWYERALGMRQPGLGVAGFPAWRLDKTPNFHADPAFLAGAIGVVLALKAATTSVEPQWDRLLQLSGRGTLSPT